MRKKTTEEFIRDARKIHGDKYDYTWTLYKNTKTKVKIECAEHGIFEIVPASHLIGRGCAKCGTKTRADKLRGSTKSFIEKSKKIHKNKYDYSKVKYTKNSDKVVISCSHHGEFTQTPAGHLRGQGCQECAGNITPTIESFINKAEFVHEGFYNYSKVKYSTYRDKIIITCPIHSDFLQTPQKHLSGQGCVECSNAKIGDRTRSCNDDFIRESNIVHQNMYDYSLSDYKSAVIPVVIICNIHGKFTQTPNAHKSGKGCPICNSSKGETLVRNHLDSQDIKHSEQYTFPDLKDKYVLRFDFAVHSDQLKLVEWQGEQHYKSVEFFGGEEQLKNQQRKDQLKRDYCKLHNIPLLEIRYDDPNPTDTIDKFLN